LKELQRFKVGELPSLRAKPECLSMTIWVNHPQLPLLSPMGAGVMPGWAPLFIKGDTCLFSLAQWR